MRPRAGGNGPFMDKLRAHGEKKANGQASADHPE
jgi:hypothetical protein